MKNYYEILQVDKNADEEIIKKIFKYHIKKNHPDLFQGEEKEDALKKVQLFNEAYEVLSDNEKRKIYDEELKIKQQEKDESDSIQRLKIENETLREEIILRDQKIQNIFQELGIEYPQYVNNYYENNQRVNANYSEVKQEKGNASQVSVTKRYYEYLKEFLLKILGMIIFIISVIIFFSVFLDYNAFQIILNILGKK